MNNFFKELITKFISKIIIGSSILLPLMYLLDSLLGSKILYFFTQEFSENTTAFMFKMTLLMICSIILISMISHWYLVVYLINGEFNNKRYKRFFPLFRHIYKDKDYHSILEEKPYYKYMERSIYSVLCLIKILVIFLYSVLMIKYKNTYYWLLSPLVIFFILYDWFIYKIIHLLFMRIDSSYNKDSNWSPWYKRYIHEKKEDISNIAVISDYHVKENERKKSSQKQQSGENQKE